MRSLSSQLTTAQQSASAEPQVDVTVENSIGGMRRLDFALLDQSVLNPAKHGVAVAGDGSVTRVRVLTGGIYQQRVTNPGSGPWDSWNTFATSRGAYCAVSAKGSTVTIIYTAADNKTIYIRESTDYGATYSAEAVLVAPAVANIAISIALKEQAGSATVARANASNQLICNHRTDFGAWGGNVTSAFTFSSINGVACAYGADYDIAVTGVEATTLARTLWTTLYGDDGDAPAAVIPTPLIQQQAASDSSVTFQAPFLAYTDTYHLTFVEADAFAGGATRAYRTSVHPAKTFIAGAWSLRAPIPVSYAGAEGLALAADAGGAGYFYESAAEQISRAPKSLVLTTLTADVLAIKLDERADATSGYIDLDNSRGAYAGPPAPIVIGNLVSVSWGYRTTAGLQSSKMADLWIAGYEHRRALGKSVLRLQLEGGWEQLRRNRQRTQIVHTGAETYQQIISRILSRAGLHLSSSSPSSRAGTVTPKYTIASQTTGFEAARQALAFLADRIRMTTLATAVITEPLASAASTYTYGAAHPLHEVRLVTEPPPVAETHAFGGAVAFGEAIDYPTAQQGSGTREQQRDITSTTGAQAAATAVAHLRRRALDAPAGAIIVPPNCGQETLDPVDFTDALISASAIKRRVAAIRWTYDRRKGVYEQELTLGAM